jgi:hypothetical protein
MASQPEVPEPEADGLADVPAEGEAADFTLDDQFRSEAGKSLGRFRLAMEKLIYSITKALQTSRDLQNLIGVDRNVSWQLFKLLGPVETLATIPYIPASISLRKLLHAAKKRGVNEEYIEEVAAAFAGLEQFISSTTGDREQFETMVMSYADSAESAQMGMHHRKAAFKADCHFFGVAVDTLAFGLLFHPGQKPDSVDFVGLRQSLGLRRLRASTDVLVDRWKMNRDNTGKTDDFLFSDALDPEAAAAHSAAVLPEFCSQPMLPLVTTLEDSGDVRTLLKHRDIGVGRDVDIATARVFRGMELSRTPDGRPMFDGLVEIGRPTRTQVIDNWVHRPTWPNMVPSAGVFAHLPRRVASVVDREGVRLPFSETFNFMGSGADVARIREVPRYPDLIKYACEKMGWRFEEMDLYRIRIEYPLMDSNILLRLQSPPVPAT